MIQTKQKSRWRGQSFVCVGKLGDYYICKVGKRNFTRIHKKEVARYDEGRDTSTKPGA